MNRASLALLLLGTLSCSRVVLDSAVHRQGDGWNLTLTKVKDGPNQVQAGNLMYSPGAGRRFLRASITLHNPSRTPRKFSFDRCDLDEGEQAILPTIIAFDLLGGGGDANREPDLAGDETIKRILIFSYPMDRSPTRLYCAPMTFALPQM